MATLEYEKEYIKQIKFKLNRKFDEDIIEHLDKITNIQGYIKDLIRADMHTKAILNDNPDPKEEDPPC